MIGISIHALRGEGDQAYEKRQRHGRYFNPRPPWGGRLHFHMVSDGVPEISIHALRGEGDRSRRDRKARRAISIHALRGEGDDFRLFKIAFACISIHALRGEGDARRP